MIGHTATTAVLSLLETSINGALKYDPGSLVALEKLHDSLLQVSCSQPDFTVFVSVRHSKLYLSSEKSVAADACIRGKLPDLLALLKRPTHSLANSGVESAGNLALIQAYQALLANLEIDWEAMLSQAVGDVAGHQVANLFRSLHAWGQTNGRNIPQHASDFLQHELNIIPTKSELAYFSQQVDELRAATERLQAKIQQLTPAPEQEQ